MCPTPTSTPSSIQVRWAGPILSRFQMCNSRGWRPSAPSREKGETPTPVLGRGWGQARAPAGGKAGRKEALVRHGAGGWGGLPPLCSSCLIHRVRRAAEGAGKTGPGGHARSGFPEGSGPHPREEAWTPILHAAFTGPCYSPAPGPWTLLLFCPHRRRGPDCPPPGHSEPDDKARKAASDRSSCAEAGCPWAPWLHASPLTGALCRLKTGVPPTAQRPGPGQAEERLPSPGL